MYDFIFSVNNKNAFDLQKEYSINKHDTGFIYRTFWPIILLNSVEINDINNEIERLIEKFKSDFQVLDYQIFYRNHLEYLVFDIKRYLNAIQKGKFKIWDTYGNTNFYWLKLPDERSSSQTLLLTAKGEIELELFFKEILREIDSLNEKLPNEISPSQKSMKSKPKLSINQIALKYVYLGNQVTRQNGNYIAQEYGHKSGEKLFQRFTYYSSAANRKGKPQPCTPRKLQNKITLLESVLSLVPTNKQGRVKDEILILKNIQEAEYH